MDDQRTVYHSISDSIENDKRVTFFIDAPGDTGKTFLIKLLRAKVDLKKNIALVVASIAITSSLLHERTAHFIFCQFLDLTRKQKSLCNEFIQCQTFANLGWSNPEPQTNNRSIRSDTAEFKRQHKSKGKSYFGSCCWFQTSIAIRKKSYLRHHIQKLSLKINMWVYLNLDNAVGEFAPQLLHLENWFQQWHFYN